MCDVNVTLLLSVRDAWYMLRKRTTGNVTVFLCVGELFKKKKKKAFKTTKESTSLKKERSLTILYSSEVTLLLNQCGQIMSSL